MSVRAFGVVRSLAAMALLAGPSVACAVPWLALPSSTPPGEPVEITGGDFPAGAALVFVLESPTGEAERRRIGADGAGRIRVEISLDRPGQYLAEVWPEDGTGQAPLVFLVVSAGARLP